jgi:hypothetical protein
LNTNDHEGDGDYCYDPDYDIESYEYKWGLSIHDSSDLEQSFGPDKSLASVHKDVLKHSIWSLVENEYCQYFEPVIYTPNLKYTEIEVKSFPWGWIIVLIAFSVVGFGLGIAHCIKKQNELGPGPGPAPPPPPVNNEQP